MPTLIHRRVDEARRGLNPKVICRVHSGWVVLGDIQLLRGYSLLLPDPVVDDLNALSAEQRKTYLYEMSVLGDALLASTNSYRINYEILGNTEAALHAHVFPRYMDEPEERRQNPIWLYDDWRSRPAFDLKRDKALMDQIASFMRAKGVCVE